MEIYTICEVQYVLLRWKCKEIYTQGVNLEPQQKNDTNF